MRVEKKMLHYTYVLLVYGCVSRKGRFTTEEL